MQRVAQVRPGVVVRDDGSSVVVDPRAPAPAIAESPARTLEHLDVSAGVSVGRSVDRNHRRSGISSDGGHASVDRVGVAHDVSELKLGQKLAADPSECAGGVGEGKATRLRERLCGPIGVTHVRRNALAVVVANRRVRVVVRHVPLAFGGDVIPTVFNVGDVESPLGTDVDGRASIPLDVDADTGTHACILQFNPRGVVGARGAARVGEVFPVRGVRVLAGGIRVRARRVHELHRHASRPERKKSRQTADVQRRDRCRAAPIVLLDELAVPEREGTIDGELDVGLNRVDHSRLPARGDGVSRAQLRQKTRVAVRALGRERTGRARCGTVDVFEEFLVVPRVGDDALAVRTNGAVALGEHGEPFPVRRLEKRLGERVV